MTVKAFVCKTNSLGEEYYGGFLLSKDHLDVFVDLSGTKILENLVNYFIFGKVLLFLSVKNGNECKIAR